MKRPPKELALALAALAASLAARPCAAQTGTWSLERPPEQAEGPHWAVSYDAGYAIAEGPDADSTEPSLLMQASVERQILGTLSGGLEVGHQFGHKLKGRFSGRYPGDLDGDRQTEYLDFNSDVKVKVFHLTPCFRLGKVFGRRGGFQVKHTVSAGGGYYFVTANEGTMTVTGRGSTGANLTGRQTTFGRAWSHNAGVHFGSALDFRFREGMSLGAELRYHNVFDAAVDRGFLVPTFRLVFLF